MVRNKNRRFLSKYVNSHIRTFVFLLTDVILSTFGLHIQKA